MKKLSSLFLIFIFIAILTSCTKEVAVPMENPQIELFHLVFEGDDYSIFKRTIIDTEKYYYMIGYPFGSDDDKCTVGEEQKDNYRFQYGDKYYDIVEANKLGIFTCNQLKEIGAIGEFVSDIKTVLLESSEWTCDEEYCTHNQTLLWNTTKYNISLDVFEILLRTEVDGIYGYATYNYSDFELEVAENENDYVCSVNITRECNLSGEQKEQIEVSIEAIHSIIIK